MGERIQVSRPRARVLGRNGVADVLSAECLLIPRLRTYCGIVATADQGQKQTFLATSAEALFPCEQVDQPRRSPPRKLASQQLDIMRELLPRVMRVRTLVNVENPLHVTPPIVCASRNWRPRRARQQCSLTTF
jgi:hypothetical protein